MRMITRLSACVLAAFMVGLVVRAVPDVARYMKIREM